MELFQLSLIITCDLLNQLPVTVSLYFCWKYQKIKVFIVFRGYRKRTVASNGLIQICSMSCFLTTESNKRFLPSQFNSFMTEAQIAEQISGPVFYDRHLGHEIVKNCRKLQKQLLHINNQQSYSRENKGNLPNFS